MNILMQFFATSSEFSKKSKICNLIEVDHTQACINIMKNYRYSESAKPLLLNTGLLLLPETFTTN